ncbi:hypothetical protein FF2_046022 [Malus domestica]
MALIHCLDEAGMFGEMWRTIQEMARSAGVIELAELSEIIRILGRAKMVTRHYLSSTKGHKFKPTANTYNSMILMLMQEGPHDKVHELYNDMCNEGNCFPDTVTYNALISALGKLGHDDSAIRLFDEMKDNGLHPTAKIYSTLLAIFFKLGKEGRIEDAIKIFNEMSSLHCTLNMVTYNTVIKVLFESRAPASEATTWFEKMKVNGIVPSSFTYSILIDGFCKTNRVENALLLLEEMDEKGFPLCPAAYCSLINSLGKAKQYKAANELFQELKEN